MIIAAADWIEIILFLLLVGGSLIGQVIKTLFNNGRQAPPKRRPPAHRPPERQAARPPVAGHVAPPRDKRTALEAEIEDFLRNAGGGRRAEPPQAEPRHADPPVRAKVVRTTSTPLPDGPRPRRPQSSNPFPPNERLSDHVSRHIGVESSPEEMHLATTISQADERMESHLHQQFDHQLGQFTAPTRAIAEGTDAQWTSHVPTNNLAEEVFELMRHPERVQALVVASEILKRPTHRWEEE